MVFVASIGSLHLFRIEVDSVMSSDADKALPVWAVVFEPIPNPHDSERIRFGRSPGRSSTRSSGSAQNTHSTYQAPTSETCASNDLKTCGVKCVKSMTTNPTFDECQMVTKLSPICCVHNVAY